MVVSILCFCENFFAFVGVHLMVVGTLVLVSILAFVSVSDGCGHFFVFVSISICECV